MTHFNQSGNTVTPVTRIFLTESDSLQDFLEDLDEVQKNFSRGSPGYEVGYISHLKDDVANSILMALSSVMCTIYSEHATIQDSNLFDVKEHYNYWHPFMIAFFRRDLDPVPFIEASKRFIQKHDKYISPVVQSYKGVYFVSSVQMKLTRVHGGPIQIQFTFAHEKDRAAHSRIPAF